MNPQVQSTSGFIFLSSFLPFFHASLLGHSLDVQELLVLVLTHEDQVEICQNIITSCAALRPRSFLVRQDQIGRRG